MKFVILEAEQFERINQLANLARNIGEATRILPTGFIEARNAIRESDHRPIPIHEATRHMDQEQRAEVKREALLFSPLTAEEMLGYSTVYQWMKAQETLHDLYTGYSREETPDDGSGV